jgi:hypothetical protein
MKKHILFTSLLALSISLFAQFTPNRIVVLRTGNGAAALTNATNVLRLVEYTYTGTQGFTKILDTTGVNRITNSGTAGSEGLISNSSDYNMIVIPGYDTTTGIAGINSTTSSNIARKMVSVFGNGNMLFLDTTRIHLSGNNIRSATVANGKYYAAGANTGVIGGVNSLDTVISNTLTNLRALGVFKNQLYVSTGSGSNRGIYMVGAGTPTNSGNTLISIINDGSAASSYQFSFNPDTNICYIADDRAISGNTAGGIQKWVRSGGVWTKVYTLGTGPGSTVGARGLAVNWAGSTPVIFLTTTETSRNRLLSLADTGALTPAIILDTAPVNTVFRGVAFTPNSNPLPVSWGSISARNNAGNIALNWSTISETNNSFFSIEHSTDGKNFVSIATVKGAGNSNRIHDYQFIHQNPNLSTANYYRIKQVDFDGAFEYSKTVVVASQKLAVPQVGTSPNPFNEVLEIAINASVESIGTAELIDMMGKTIDKKTINIHKGDNKIIFDTHKLNSGIYFIRVMENGNIQTRKVTKK